MSCVVGIADGEHVWMGADSQVSGDANKYILRDGKVGKRGGMLIGGVGTYRIVQRVTRLFSPPPHKGKGVTTFICGPFMAALLKFIGSDNGGDNGEKDSFALLVGYRGRLFHISDDWSVIETVTDFACVGHDAAAGVLWHTMGQEPESRIQLALQAASELSPYVSPPFIIEKL